MAGVPHRLRLPAARRRGPVRQRPRRARAVGVGRAAAAGRRARPARRGRPGDGRAHDPRLPRLGASARAARPAAIAGEPSWTPERRFDRVFERLALPGPRPRPALRAARLARAAGPRRAAPGVAAVRRRRHDDRRQARLRDRRQDPARAPRAHAGRRGRACRSRRWTSRCSTGARGAARGRRTARARSWSTPSARRSPACSASDATRVPRTCVQLRVARVAFGGRRADASCGATEGMKMNPRVKLLKELVSDGHVRRSTTSPSPMRSCCARRRATCCPTWRSAAPRGREPEVRSFRPHRGAKSFRLTRAERRPVHRAAVARRGRRPPDGPPGSAAGGTKKFANSELPRCR